MVETVYMIPGAPHLALLSDLHGRDPKPVLASVRNHAPSLICITGDILYGSHPEGDRSPLDTQEHVLPFLSGCAAIAPTFLSLGNHEWALDHEDIEKIKSTDVTVLDNEWCEIEVDGKEIVIGGLTSAYVTDYRRFVATLDPAERARARYPKKDTISGIGGAVTASQHKPESGWLDEFSSAPGFKICLSHHPEYFPFVPSTVDLILSGHAHGGQWRFFGRGVFAPGQGFWPRWSKGVYDGKMVVSTGLANTASIPRLFNPTEIVYLESP